MVFKIKMLSILIFILLVLHHIPPSSVLPRSLQRYLVGQRRSRRPLSIQSQREDISETQTGTHRCNLRQELESLELPFQIGSMVLGQRVTTMATEVGNLFLPFLFREMSSGMLISCRLFSSRQNFPTNTRQGRRSHELPKQFDCHCKMGFQTQRCKRWQMAEVQQGRSNYLYWLPIRRSMVLVRTDEQGKVWSIPIGICSRSARQCGCFSETRYCEKLQLQECV